MLQQRGENDALQAAVLMQQGQVVELTSAIALSAARLSTDTKLPMVDSIRLAIAHAHNATFWTQDADFEGVAGMKFVAKRRA